MSTPVSSFRKLSLSNSMQSSADAPAQFGGSRKGKERASAVQQIDVQSDEDVNSGSGSMEVQDPEEVAEVDIPRGRPVYAIHHCRQVGPIYGFQFAYAEVKRSAIRIWESGYNCAACGDQVDCSHITWLLERLSQATLNTSARAGPLTPYEQIKATGLQALCDELHCELRNPPDSEQDENSDSDAESSSDSDSEDNWRLKRHYSPRRTGKKTQSMIRERMLIVRDIMATLSSKFTEDYRNDLFQDRVDMPPGPFIGDVERTISGYLLLDDDAFYHFKSLVPDNVRAQLYFRNAYLKASNVFEALDKYIEYGPVDGPYSVIWCADTLTSLVQSLKTNLLERQRLSSAAKAEAANALVFILHTVVRNKNVEAYANSSWDRPRPHLEPTRDRNLFVRLIKEPSPGTPEMFVLHALEDLPEAQPSLPKLLEILMCLKETAWQAPQAYVAKLEGIIVRLGGDISSRPDPRSRSGRRSKGPPETGPGTTSGRRSRGAGTPEAGPSFTSGKRSRGTGPKEDKSNKRMK